ncbi:MAG: hypothetical protein HYY18_07720 [Planctomycetes bacterium]|nr:hypothetical protein [Planctomycetota bacterium]
MLRIACRCGQTMQVSEESAGQTVECLSCGAMLTVSVATPTVAPARPSPEGGFHLPISASLGAILVIAFFLPWLRISCKTTMLAEPTGFNLATNTEDATMKKLTSESRGPGTAPQPSSDEKGTPPWGKSTPELWLFPLLGAGLAGWGVLRMKQPGGDTRLEAKRVLIVVVAALALLAVERMSWYRKASIGEMKEGADKAKSTPAVSTPGPPGFDEIESELNGAFEIRNGSGFWLTLASLLGVAGCLGAWLFRGGADRGGG